MTKAQRQWFIQHIYAERKLQSKKFELQLKAINPMAFSSQDEPGTFKATEYIADVEDMIGRKLTDQEKEAIQREQQGGASVDIVG